MGGGLQSPWVKPDSSDSEMSDAESSVFQTNKESPSNISPQAMAIRIKAAKAKVRQIAYGTIRLLLLNIDKKERFG